MDASGYDPSDLADGPAIARRLDALLKQGALEDADTLSRQALDRFPEDAKILLVRARVQQACGLIAAARESYQKALGAGAPIAATCNAIGNLELKRGRIDAAMRAYQRALDHDPDLVSAHHNLGLCARAGGDYRGAQAHFQAAVERDPLHPDALHHLVRLKLITCDWAGLPPMIARLKTALNLLQRDGGRLPLSPLAGIDLGLSARELTGLIRHHTQRHVKAAARIRDSLDLPAPPSVSPGARMKIGYISADFVPGTMGDRLAQLLGGTDRKNFSVFCYATRAGAGDRFHSGLRTASDHFLDVRGLAARDLARRIAADGVQVLLDLTGFGPGGRPDVLSLRPAPVQLAFPSCPLSLGGALCDYLVADPFVIAGAGRHEVMEQPLRLIGGALFSDRHPSSALDIVREDFALPPTGPVIAAFMPMTSVTSDDFATWMRILARVPEATLWMLDGGPLARANLSDAAEARGIESKRLVFTPVETDRARLLRRWQLADLCLAPLRVPHLSGACLEALWVGVPVLARAGAIMPERVDAAILQHLGLDLLIFENEGKLEDFAIALLENPLQRKALHEDILARVESAALYDPARVTRQLERAYQAVWRRHQAGEPLAALDIPVDGAAR